MYIIYFNDNSQNEDVTKIEKESVPCNILRQSHLVGLQPIYVTFDYEFSIETQGDSLWLQFPSNQGGFLKPVLWTGKGTYDLIDRNAGRAPGPVKIWTTNPNKNVWVKISEVIKCD